MLQAILERIDISSSEKILLVAIDSSRLETNAYLVAVSISRLAELTSLSSVHVMRLIKSLEERKLLYVEREGKERNMYQIMIKED